MPAEALAACGEEACRYVGDIAASYREVVPLSVDLHLGRAPTATTA